MKFPLVSRDRYDEMRQTLTERIHELTTEVHKWQDLFAEKATGRRLYEEPPRESGTEQVKEPSPIDEHPLVRARRALGTKAKPRDIVNYFQKENNEEFAAATRTLGPPDPPNVPDDMQTAVNEGRQSAV